MSDYIEKKSISLELAQRICAAAVQEAQSLDGAFSVAVVDESGVLKAVARMDGAGISSVQVATDKAYTAVATGMSTDAWNEYGAGDPTMGAGARGIDRLQTFPGGYAIAIDDTVIGAIGVSGGHYEQDATVAKAGLAVLSGAAS